MNADNPWMTTQQASTHTGYHKQTLYKAARLYRRTKGKKGLRASQRVPNGSFRFRREDLDRWMNSEPPKRAYAA